VTLVERGERLTRAGEAVAQDDARGGEHLGERGVLEPVEDGVALAACGDDARVAQHGEVLGQVRGLDPGRGEELAHGELTVAQELEGAYPDGVRESLEEVCLVVVEGALGGERHRGPSAHAMWLIDGFINSSTIDHRRAGPRRGLATELTILRRWPLL